MTPAAQPGLGPQGPPPGTGFDMARLVVDGRESRWSMDQFRELPLLDRIRVLAGGHVRFFRGGTEIPARDALRGL